MKTYTEKENKVILKISNELQKLDNNLKILDHIEDDTGKLHRMQRWNADRNAIHEIKNILHEINKYKKEKDRHERKLADNYYRKNLEEAEMNPYLVEMNPYGRSLMSENYNMS